MHPRKKEFQCDIPTLGKFSIEGTKHNSKMIAYYTGFNGYDHFMAYREILVQDLFANHNVSVNTHTLLKGKSRPEHVNIDRDRKVASKRIHVESDIGLAKRFEILKQ